MRRPAKEMTIDAGPGTERKRTSPEGQPQRSVTTVGGNGRRQASPILRARADWLGILDAVYGATAASDRWAKEVVDAASRVFGACEGVSLFALRHDDQCRVTDRLFLASSWQGGEQALRREGDFSAGGREMFRAFFYPPIMVASHAELEVTLEPGSAEYIREARRQAGIEDAVGIVVHPEPNVAAVLFAAFRKRASITKHERRSLIQLGLHLENGLRFRGRASVTRGWIDMAGHYDLDGVAAVAGPSLAASARRIEGARRRSPAALDLWHALVAGRYSLVPRYENGVRRYAVIENAPSSRALRALSDREVDVLSVAARGVPSKLVAYGLGISAPVVSSSLRDASAKLGLTSRLDLLRLAAMLTGDHRAHAPSATLTSAEQEILELLRQGLSNAQIAKHRSRSIRTIANQVASLLRKTRSTSRRALVAS